MTAEAPVLEITLPPLHPSQREIAKSPARFKVVCCGRRWGKSMLGIVVCLRAALKGGRVWWVAPTYKQALEGWTYLQRLVSRLPDVKTQVSELTIHTSMGGSIQIRTGDNPDNLRGAGLDGVVLDEAATMKAEVWDLVLRPALADRQGWAMFISTPQHFNWFYDLYERAEADETGTWASWQHPTWGNPFIPEAEIGAARRDMADEDFDQEFGASFTAIGGAVFADLSLNRPFFLRPMPAELAGQFYRRGVGMDWGTTKQHRWNVTGAAMLSNGAVWIRSSKLSDSGSDNEWLDEATRCKRDQGATFARYDRSQSSIHDRLVKLGFDADKGIADVEARIGVMKGLVKRRAVFWDSNDPGARESFMHFCEYHRYPDSHAKAGQIVEENDDDVDGGLYVVAELVQPRYNTRAIKREYSQAEPAVKNTWL